MEHADLQVNLQQQKFALKDLTAGIWKDDPKADSKINQFITSNDIYTDPTFQLNQQLTDDAAKIMQIRQDSKGSPLRRAIVGERFWYDRYLEKIEEDRNKTFKQSTRNLQPMVQTQKPVIQPSLSPLPSALLSPQLSPHLSPASSLAPKTFLKNHDSRVSFKVQNNSRFNLGFGTTQLSNESIQSERILRVVQNHNATKMDWNKILETLKEQRRDYRNNRFQKDPSRKSSMTIQPCNVSVLERSSSFKYDSYGSKVPDDLGIPHICSNSVKPRDRHDVVAQKNRFMQSLHNGNVTYNPVGKKAAIFSTVPSKSELRAVLTKLTKKPVDKLELHEITSTIQEEEGIFGAKERKGAQFLPELSKIRGRLNL